MAIDEPKDDPQSSSQNIGVSVSGSTVGGDVTGRDKITIGDNSTVIINQYNSLSPTELAAQIVEALLHDLGSEQRAALTHALSAQANPKRDRQIARALSKELDRHHLVIDRNGRVLGREAVEPLPHRPDSIALARVAAKLLEAQSRALTLRQFVVGLFAFGLIIATAILVGPIFLPSLQAPSPTPTCVPASTQGLQLISSEDTGLPFDWRSEVIKAVAYDSQANVLWIGSLHHLAWFDHNTNQWHESPLPANFGLEALAVDKDSSLWMGGAQGLAVTEPKASASITPVVDEHMLATEVRALAVDGDGYLWIGYYRREAVYGLNAYNPHAPSDWLTLVDQNNPAFSMVNSLTIGEDDIVWAATDAGLLRLDSAGVRTAYTAAEGFAGNRVPSDDIRVVVPLEDGQVWISTFGGNIILDDGASADKSDDAWLESDPTQLGLAAIPLTAFATDPEGAIWLGTHHGLWRWFEGGGCQIDFASGLAVTAMALDTGATATPRRWLWVGTENGGLYVWKFE